MKASFGWTVVARGGGQTDSSKDEIYVYKRDCPADAAHLAADLAPFTHDTKAKAIAAGKRGEYAYKRNEVCSARSIVDGWRCCLNAKHTDDEHETAGGYKFKASREEGS